MSPIKFSSRSPFFLYNSSGCRAARITFLGRMADVRIYKHNYESPSWLFGKLSEEDDPTGPSLAAKLVAKATITSRLFQRVRVSYSSKRT